MSQNTNFTRVLRDSAILTTSYVAATVLGGSALAGKVEEYNEVVFYCYYTKGSLTSLELKIESSLNGSDYVTETNMSISGATATLNKGEFTTTEDGNFKVSVPMSAKFVKISAKGTGTVTSSLLGIEVMAQYI